MTTPTSTTAVMMAAVGCHVTCGGIVVTYDPMRMDRRMCQLCGDHGKLWTREEHEARAARAWLETVDYVYDGEEPNHEARRRPPMRAVGRGG